MLRDPAAVRVLAVHDLRLVGVQLESNRPEPFSECQPTDSGLCLGVAVDHRVIRVTFERLAGVLPVHPPIERVVHEKVGDQRRDRRALWGPLLSWREGPVRHLHGGFEPPFDVEQDPPLVGVVSDRFEQQIMGNAVERLRYLLPTSRTPRALRESVPEGFTSLSLKH